MICTVLDGNEVLTPPLLTVRVSASLPTGHVRVALAVDAVPQLPVQLKATGQLLGSVAEPLTATLTPVELVAFTV